MVYESVRGLVSYEHDYKQEYTGRKRHIKGKQVTHDIDKNNSDVISWENIKAPGSAFESNSSASFRLSLNGLQLNITKEKNTILDSYS